MYTVIYGCVHFHRAGNLLAGPFGKMSYRLALQSGEEMREGAGRDTFWGRACPGLSSFQLIS